MQHIIKVIVATSNTVSSTTFVKIHHRVLTKHLWSPVAGAWRRILEKHQHITLCRVSSGWMPRLIDLLSDVIRPSSCKWREKN